MERVPGFTSELRSVIENNVYVKNCDSNKAKDTHSLSSLIDRDLSQSDCIKLGTGAESVIRDIVCVKNPALKNIKPKNTLGKKEKDHLFVDEVTKTLYYAELKGNLNLDTEKCKSTSDKCSKIEAELKDEFPGYTVNMYLLGVRYYDKKIIPEIIKKKYSCIANNLIGVNDYFKALNVPVLFADEQDYREFLNYLANSMFVE
jgi:hypothetical protein